MTSVRRSPPYSAYARIYDRIGQRAFGERMACVILELLSSHGRQSASVLDLGCGTGAATLAFARRGLRAVGVDRSAEMLDRARSLAEQERLAVEFIESDMIDPPANGQFDLVTCIYDAFNYLEDESAAFAFLLSVHRRLLPDGYFVFDMNTRARLESSWEHGLVLAHDADDLYVTYRSWFDPDLDASPLIMTAFIRNESGDWDRFDEEHIERAWPIDRVSRWLEDAGFRVVEVLGYVDSSGDVHRPAGEDHGRVVFVAAR